MSYQINAYGNDSNGTDIYIDRDYALGQYARATWETREAAEEVASELREDVGDVVDESVTYEVVED